MGFIRYYVCLIERSGNADVAQLVEHGFRKAGVAGSTPAVGFKMFVYALFKEGVGVGKSSNNQIVHSDED